MNPGLLAKVGRSVGRRGLFGTARHAVRLVADRILEEYWDRRAQRTRRRIDDRFDREFGIETAGRLAPEELDVSGGSVVHSSHYEAVYPGPFIDLMAQLPIDFERSLFIDVGSGKGRAVLMASEFPFRKIIGVEFSPRLHRIAEANGSRYRSATQKCKSIEWLCIDAVDYAIPPEPAVLFMYNPFRQEVLTRIVANIERSLREAPRMVFVVYFNPRFRGVLDGIEALEAFPVRQPIWPASRGPVVGVWVTRGSLSGRRSPERVEEFA